jgi:hypothetical protein
MKYQFGCARKLYATNQHPRLLLGPTDLPLLRKRIRAGDGRRIMVCLRKRVASVVQPLLSSGDVAGLIRQWGISGTENVFGGKVMLALGRHGHGRAVGSG